MNKKLTYIFKVLAAATCAFVVLNMFSLIYYNIPVHVKSETYSTDHIWQSNKFYSKATEGFAYGKTDANGFNNLEIPEDVNILVMGSSQMEAFNVMQDENTVCKLNEKFKTDDSHLRAYNIGISGHSLIMCVNNLENAIKEFTPSDYVIIETQLTKFSVDTMKEVLSGKYKPEEKNSNPIVNELQKVPYIRLLYYQYSNFVKDDSNNAKKEIDESEYTECINAIMKKAADAVPDGCRLIILLDDAIKVDERGMVEKRNKDFYYNSLKDACESAGVELVDMYDVFSERFENDYVFAHGFGNSKVGAGHLNRYGHEMIAQKLFEKLNNEGE